MDRTSERPDVRFEYDPGTIRYGAGCVAELADELARQGLGRALVVCGSTVGNTPAVIDPVKEGLGDRLAGVFAETTPEKRLETAVDAVDAMRELEADALVSLGGGSSLDVAKVASVLAASGRSPSVIGRELAGTGSITTPSRRLPSIVAVPTTLAGADLSQVAGITAAPEGGLVDEPVGGGVSDRRLMPSAVFYDPDLFATTPPSVLAGSAMNGFDKGLETLYARAATPVTDATASRGLGLMRAGLTGLGDDPDDEGALRRAVEGVLLVQYGISRPDGTTLSLVHAFGHGLTAHSSVQQGVAHAIVVPHVLRYLFERIDARRDLLAEALDVPRDGRSADEIADGVVDAVTEVRDALELPSRLRSIDDLGRDDLADVAETTIADRFVDNGPAELDPTAGDLEGVLEAAW